MHLAERLDLPAPYSARAYRGADDHRIMAPILAAYRWHCGVPEMPTAEQMDVTYAHLDDCDPDTDIALIECGGATVAYVRTSYEDLGTGVRDCVVFAPTHPDHIGRRLFEALVSGQETHMEKWAADADARLRAYASHPGPGKEADGEAAWLESLGYVDTEWSAILVRPHLDEIPERSLPDGVEIRPVEEEHVRTILDAHFEAFRGEWDFHEPVEADYVEFTEHPDLDVSLWRVAWAGNEVVGQVKSYVNAEENAERGYLRGYTEDISTHRDWRARGIAGALLAESLKALRDRGMTEAALGVDTNNPGGAFQLYTGLGFELQSYEAVYTKPFPAGD